MRVDPDFSVRSERTPFSGVPELTPSDAFKTHRVEWTGETEPENTLMDVTIAGCDDAGMDACVSCSSWLGTWRESESGFSVREKNEDGLVGSMSNL